MPAQRNKALKFAHVIQLVAGPPADDQPIWGIAGPHTGDWSGQKMTKAKAQFMVEQVNDMLRGLGKLPDPSREKSGPKKLLRFLPHSLTMAKQ